MLVSGFAGAAVHRVPGEYDTIQEALDACSPSDPVSVAPGLYTGPGNRALTLTSTPVLLTSESGAALTTIDCELETRAMVLGASADSTTTIQGFTFTRGTPAVRVWYGKPRFLDCIFAANASGDGGAVSVDSHGQPVFRRCEFRENTSSSCGGAISCFFAGAVISDCMFAENVAREGGAIHIDEGGGSPGIIIRRCEFIGNSAIEDGGAVSGRGYVSRFLPGAATESFWPNEIADCLFDSNSASGGGWYPSCGGGLCFLESWALVSGCTFKANSADRGGGLAFTGVIRGCVLAGNEAGEHGGGVLFDVGEMENCTIVENVAPEGAGIYTVSNCSMALRSTVLAWNYPGGAITFGTKPNFTVSLEHCLAYANGADYFYSFTDNIVRDPLFCDLDEQDFSVCADSPCLAENNDWGVDVGAYGEACGPCGTAVERASWGRIKAMFR
jgi:predicted outer membrane repeat protein